MRNLELTDEEHAALLRRYLCARRGEPLCHAQANPAIAAGNDGDPSGKIEQCHREPPIAPAPHPIDSDRVLRRSGFGRSEFGVPK
jgi:hypothetical protein